MMLSALVLIPFIGGLLAWLLGRTRSLAARWLSLVALAAQLGLLLWIAAVAEGGGSFLVEVNTPWIPDFGIRYHLGLDGLSLLMLLLTALLGGIAILVSWREITVRVGLFHACLLWVLAGITGVFLALDLILFYCFWEIMLVPMYFLIGVWGHERRIYAAIKFFLFTQASSLLMLIAILALAFLRASQTGAGVSFDLPDLLGTSLTPFTGLLLMLGFFVGFGVKLPVVPLHSWLPDAHGEAPTAGSVILAGLLLKTGAYGLIRFVLPLFPEACAQFAPVAMALAAFGILYGAVLAFAQTDLKRLIAYTSVSHMGFVLLGVFAGTGLALQGAILQMVAHALSTGGLFALAGMLVERFHTRELGQLGGLKASLPRLSAAALVLALASLGLPGLGNFAAEMLVLFGSFAAGLWPTVLATFGVVLATVYSLWMIQQVFHGRERAPRPAVDLGRRELSILAVLIALLVWLGVYPQPVLQQTAAVVEQVQRAASDSPGVAP